MYFKQLLFLGIISCSLACSSANKTQKGAAIGGAGGAAAGAIIGRVAGNTAIGAVIGAVVGGATGAVIGRRMDKQAEEIKKQVPTAKVDRVGEGIVIEFSDKVLFGYGKSDLTSADRQNIGKLTDILTKYPDTDVEIRGHTDNKGAVAFNQTLSEQRASSVKNYLVSGGISSSRLNSVGFGESQPKVSNDTEDGRAQNRRVEFVITANNKMKTDASNEAAKSGGH